jgi:aerobic-type carbon monoxide dehydrogenase small subunit (CoxS/CutS family)
MANYILQINKSTYEVSVEKGSSLLRVIREQLRLTGTKYGCEILQCRA